METNNKPVLSFEYKHGNEIYTIDIATIDESDTERLVKIWNDKEIAKNVWDTFPHPYSDEDAQYRIETWSKIENSINYWIYINNLYAGNLGRQKKYTGRSVHNIHFWYWLWREYWWRWIMTHIVQQVIPYIFHSLPDAHRIYARVFWWNIWSKKVLEKAWMKLEAHRKEFIWYEGSRHDEYEYAILKNNL